MVKNPILHKDGLPTSTCRIGLPSKGGGGSSERGYQLFRETFFVSQISNNLKNLSYKIMKSIFAILSFLSFVTMVIGLIKPSFLQKVFKSPKLSRWKIFGFTIILIMMFSGLSEVNFQNNQNIKYNLTEQNRMQLYKVVVSVEVIARKEADALITFTVENVNANKEKFNELRGEYIINVLNKYNIDEPQEKEIVNEGLRNSWELD